VKRYLPIPRSEGAECSFSAVRLLGTLAEDAEGATLSQARSRGGSLKEGRPRCGCD
jgi:hypothetical protein